MEQLCQLWNSRVSMPTAHRIHFDFGSSFAKCWMEGKHTLSLVNNNWPRLFPNIRVPDKKYLLFMSWKGISLYRLCLEYVYCENKRLFICWQRSEQVNGHWQNKRKHTQHIQYLYGFESRVWGKGFTYLLPIFYSSTTAQNDPFLSRTSALNPES